MQKRVEYTLEVYELDSMGTVRTFLQGATPFGAIQYCNIIHCADWSELLPSLHIRRVVGVEHILWEAPKAIKHKICIFTKAVKDTPKHD